MDNDSAFIAKESCPECGSRDNLARYSDGHGFCFGCHHYEKGDGMETTTVQRSNPALLPAGEYKSLKKRGIHQDTCEKFGYTIGDFGGAKVQIAPYYDNSGTLVAQKIRWPNKEFRVLGDLKDAGLFGQHLCRDGGKRLILVEGECDTLAASQMFGNRWPVCSVPNGAQGAKKAVQKHYEFVSSYDEVVICFDNDEPGRAAASEVASILSPGKAKIATLALKDPCDMLASGREKEFVSAIFEAKTYRPDGIVNGLDIYDTVMTDEVDKAWQYPWQKLQEMTQGYRPGELIMWTAGSGIGKSSLVREIEWDMLRQGETIGIIRLEESVKMAARDLMGLAINKRARKLWADLTPEEKKQAYDLTLGTGRVFLYDHFGSTDIDNIVSRIRYLAIGCQCRMVVVDHVSIIVSGEEGDERRMLDNLMTALKSVAMETKVVLHVISHLKRPQGDKGHEDGMRTSLSQLRGSHSLAQLSDFVIGVERNQQDEKSRNVNGLRILKNRYTGETGEAGWLLYDQNTGRLTESIDNPFEDTVPHVGQTDQAF